ncbi:MAG: enhanced intracellular survival protein Eis [Promethearchaeota archaeon]
MEIRKITNKERSTLMDLYRYAYTEWTDQPVKDEELDEIIVEETLGIFDNGQLVSSLRIHDFQQSIRGILKNCGGVAGVATYPEARTKGYVRQLMRAGFKQMHEDGQSVSMLDPFKPSFYEKFGYVTANAPYIVEAPINHLQASNLESSSSEWTYERLRAVEVQEPFLKFIREVGPKQYHGFIIFRTITPAMWKQRVKDSLVVFIRHKGKIQAVCRYRIKGERSSGRWQANLTVIDSLWRTREARNHLFYFLSRHQDQIDNIIIHAPFETKVEHWFKDIRLKVDRKTPWMVRIVDVIKAFEKLPGVGEDIITIEVSDADCPWNHGIFSLTSEKGSLHLAKSSGHPVVNASIEALSSLVYGTQPLEELEFEGKLTITEEWARHTLHRWFPPLPLYNVVYF